MDCESAGWENDKETDTVAGFQQVAVESEFVSGMGMAEGDMWGRGCECRPWIVGDRENAGLHMMVAVDSYIIMLYPFVALVVKLLSCCVAIGLQSWCAPGLSSEEGQSNPELPSISGGRFFVEHRH